MLNIDFKELFNEGLGLRSLMRECLCLEAGCPSSVEFYSIGIFEKNNDLYPIVKRFIQQGWIDDSGILIIRYPVFDQCENSSFVIENGVEKRIVTHLTNASIFRYFYYVPYPDEPDEFQMLIARENLLTECVEYLPNIISKDITVHPMLYLSQAYSYGAGHSSDEKKWKPFYPSRCYYAIAPSLDIIRIDDGLW